ncbi:hypothetical protein COO91_09187 (plasmid) [Nostoc flagelliforme CCNUN1]|uniref:Uncharacterized protein n=2 Tax=Nostoc flagelliforme TaxID=1306274 RepID=A0A2K8T5U2_9NOSO|nr:hypothetical protein [Nostoc flagelliforme]ADO19254.1 hypothetical protein Nfla_8002 [Nostoc flagelliforme str. Sunitezuoqi]AUB43031.1 hypothetical protein COO91_09187 [Nostoc flagelliforme CCNUN1]
MGATKPSISVRATLKKEKLNNSQNENMKHLDQDEIQEAFNLYKDIYVNAYDKHKSYTTLVISAGYVIFFNFWKSAKDIVPKEVLLISGLSMTISVSIFICYEIYKMIQDGFFIKKLNKILIHNNVADFVSEMQKVQEREDAYYCIWLSFLVPTLITAFVGVFFLIGAFSIEAFHELFTA